MQVIWHLQLVSFKSLRGTPAPHHHWEGTEQSSIFLPLQHPEGERVWASGGGGHKVWAQSRREQTKAEEAMPRAGPAPVHLPQAIHCARAGLDLKAWGVRNRVQGWEEDVPRTWRRQGSAGL